MWNKVIVCDGWWCVSSIFLYAPLQIFLLNKIYTNTPVPQGVGGQNFVVTFTTYDIKFVICWFAFTTIATRTISVFCCNWCNTGNILFETYTNFFIFVVAYQNTTNDYFCIFYCWVCKEINQGLVGWISKMDWSAA